MFQNSYINHCHKIFLYEYRSCTCIFFYVCFICLYKYNESYSQAVDHDMDLSVRPCSRYKRLSAIEYELIYIYDNKYICLSRCVTFISLLSECLADCSSVESLSTAIRESNKLTHTHTHTYTQRATHSPFVHACI